MMPRTQGLPNPLSGAAREAAPAPASEAPPAPSTEKTPVPTPRGWLALPLVLIA